MLDPNINYCDWTAEEVEPKSQVQVQSCSVVTDGSQDANLLHAVLTYGTNWATIACSHRPKRTTLALRNRYSTLRLQNNNNRNKANEDTTEKAHKDLPDTSAKEMDWSFEAPRSSNWNEGDRGAQSSDDDDGDGDDGDEDDGDEDEDEENEDGENEDGENEDGENEDEGLHQSNHTMPSSQGANHDADARSIQIPNSNPTSWDTWATRSIVSANSMDDKVQPISTDSLAIDGANHMQYQTLLGLNSPAQYPTPGESFFYNVPEPGGMNTSVPKTIYGKNPLLHFPPSKQGHGRSY